MIGEIAPAVLDAVAAFAYGLSAITDALERYDRRPIGPGRTVQDGEDGER